jgi:hypothetical protein
VVKTVPTGRGKTYWTAIVSRFAVEVKSWYGSLVRELPSGVVSMFRRTNTPVFSHPLSGVGEIGVAPALRPRFQRVGTA